MHTNLSIQLSDDAFTALSNEASVLGKTPAELAANVVERVYGGEHITPIDANTARQQFEQCFGSVDLGRPIGISNREIEADLAHEYEVGSP
jgi:hypothetical protein